MQLNQAINGFLLFKEAAGLRPKTVRLYRHHLGQFVAWYGDQPLEQLSAIDINRFLAYLRTEYRPTRFSGSTEPLSSQSIYNTYTALKSFTRWTHETLDMPDIMTGRVQRPRVTREERQPFTETEVQKLLAAVKPRRGDRAVTRLYYLTDLRDKGLILLLLDTGIRAGELCRLTIGDVNLQSGQVSIRDGKGGRPRFVWIGSNTRAAIWRYLQERQADDPAAPVFISATQKPLTPHTLQARLIKIGARVGVTNIYTHRFRYTFAINYLRNGGDVFTLQSLLGHTTMAMVQHYIKLAQADIEQAHRRASPVDHWLK